MSGTGGTASTVGTVGTGGTGETGETGETGRTAGARPRRHDLDLLRIVACLMVVMVHTIGSPAWSDGDPASAQWGALNLMSAFQRACVPLFLMISGAMVLGRPTLDRARLLRHNVGRLVLLYVVWSPLYALALATLTEGTTYADVPWRAVDGYTHLWYLPTMAICYLLVPAVHAAAHGQRLPLRWTALVLAGLVTASQVVAMLPNDNRWVASVSTLVDPSQALYMVYVILGGWLDRFRVSRRGALVALIVLWVVTLGGAAANRWNAVSVAHEASTWAYPYLGPMTVVQTVCMFLLATSLREWRPRHAGLLTRLSSMTLGVYLIHPLLRIITGALGISEALAPSPWIGVPLMCVALAGTSFLLTWGAQSVPGLRKAF